MRHSQVALLASLLAMGLTLGYLFLVELALDGDEPHLQAGARRLMAYEGSGASRLSKLKLKMRSRAAARDKVEELKENILPADDVRGRSTIKEEVKLLAAKVQLREKIDALKEAPELTGDLAGSPEYELRKSEMMAVRRHLEEQMRELADRDGSLHEMRLELAQLMRDLERAKKQSKLDERPEEVDPVGEALALETEQQLAEVEEEIEATRHVFEGVKEQFLQEDQAEQREDQTERERLHSLADSARKKEDPQREKELLQAKAHAPDPLMAAAAPTTTTTTDETGGQEDDDAHEEEDDAEELAEQQADTKQQQQQQQQQADKEEEPTGKKAGVFDAEEPDHAMMPQGEEEQEQEQEQEDQELEKEEKEQQKQEQEDEEQEEEEQEEQEQEDEEQEQEEQELEKEL